MSYPVVVREDGNAIPLLKEETPPCDIFYFFFFFYLIFLIPLCSGKCDGSAKVN